MVNAHLIVGDGGNVLVDAGLPGATKAVGETLTRHGLTWSSIKAIVVTHAHVDHAGGTAELRDRTGAQVIAHAAERAHLAGIAPLTFCPTGWVGRLFVGRSFIHERYRPVEPDVVLDGDQPLDLARFGVAGHVRHTGGHTAGSLAVTLATGEALVGDLVASGMLLGGIARIGHPIRPPFEDDPPAVGAALDRLLADGATTFYLGHGGPLDARTVARHARMLRTAPRGVPHPQRMAKLLGRSSAA